MSYVTPNDSYESAVKAAQKNRKTNMIFCVAIVAIFLVYSLFFQPKTVAALMDDQLFCVVPLEGDNIICYLTDIDSVEFHDTFSEFDRGTLQSGAEEASCYSGSYVNDAFGSYELHVNLKADCYLVIRYADGVVVCSSDTAENTSELYSNLLTAISD